MSPFVCQHVYLHHPVGLGRRLAARDLVDVLHPLRNLAPKRVLARKLAAARTKADKELAVGAVGVVGARGADAAALELLLRELGRDIGKLGTARALARRITRLRHEAGDHAME